MENTEEVMQILERFTRLKQKEIPKELDEYLQYVAKTGDPVFKWPNLKYLFREKLLNVITHFHDTTRMDEVPPYPNVDPFNYESMKSSLLERLELFNAAPFTIQRLCELLIDPKKQYNRIDKFMRALEKNILVSTVEPGRKRTESENGDSLDSVVNGDISLDVNVDIDMEGESIFKMEATQNGNGTASIASPISAATNDSESAGDIKNGEEIHEPVVNVTSTHEPPTTDDDDLQPSPKKAKLDDRTDSEANAVTAEVNSTSTKNAEKAAAAVAAEEKAPPVVAEVVDKKVVAETKKDEEKEKDVVKSSEGTSEATATAESKPETKVDVAVKAESEKPQKETVDSSSSKETKTPKTVTDNGVSNDVTVVDAVKAENKKEIKEEDDKLDEISSAVDQKEEKEKEKAGEKIIEKQEIEKCEKAAVKEESKSETPTQSENEKPDKPKDLKEASKKEVDSSEAETSGTVTVEAATPGAAKAEPVEVTSAVEKENEKLITSSSATPSKQSTTPSKSEAKKVEESKTEDVEACVTTTEDVPSVDASKTEPTVPVEPASSITSTSSSEKTAAATVAEADTAVTATATATATSSEAAAVATATPEITDESPAVKTDADAETPTSVVEPIAAAAVPATISPPALALNDQPMDEDAIASVVDEVVMAESTTTATTATVAAAATSVVGDGTEMATDAMEATVSSDVTSKAELVDGMDVDDTSPQGEAMDQ